MTYPAPGGDAWNNRVTKGKACSGDDIVLLLPWPGEEQYRKVESIVVHSGFDSDAGTPENDIALLRLADPLELDGNTVSPICLPSPFANSTGEGTT